MRLSNSNIRHTHVWNEVKKWTKEDKVNLITLLSMSLADSSNAEEPQDEKTRKMIDKYAGCWCGNESADDIIRAINEGKHSSMEPLSF